LGSREGADLPADMNASRPTDTDVPQASPTLQGLAAGLAVEVAQWAELERMAAALERAGG